MKHSLCDLRDLFEMSNQLIKNRQNQLQIRQNGSQIEPGGVQGTPGRSKGALGGPQGDPKAAKGPLGVALGCLFEPFLFLLLLPGADFTFWVAQKSTQHFVRHQ